jgi:Putative prokaryotic signal transducing protein
MSNQMVEVGRFPTRQSAEFAHGALASAGIESVIESDDAGGAYPFDLSGGARLLVADADAEDAAAFLAAPPEPNEQ